MRCTEVLLHPGNIYPASALTLEARRDTFLEPVLRWITPFDTPRMMAGSAAFKAVWAAVLSPAVSLLRQLSLASGPAGSPTQMVPSALSSSGS
jgi:hypothetical protein